MNKLDFVFVIDSSYLQHFTVTLTSLLETNKNIVGRVFCIHSILEDRKLKRILTFFEKKYAIKIELFFIDPKVVIHLKTTHHISIAAYYKLFISEILPRDISKLLFLDVDLIIVNDISPLIDILKKDSFDNYFLFAVDHRWNESDLSYMKKFGFRSNRYFNSGVMLINLDRWRKENITEKLLNAANEYNKDLMWWDQDILNIVFEDKWGELGYEYNAFHLDILKNNINYDKLRIIHFTGSSKPWHFMNNHSYKREYWKYLRKTPFKFYIPEDFTILNLIKRFIPQKLKQKIKNLYE